MATSAQPYGIVLPITHGSQGFFNQSYNIIDQVKSNLVMLLQTKKGERRLNQDFGSGLWSVLFENYTEDIGMLVENTIRKDISKWMNYVNVSKVTVDSNTTENINKYTVKLTILFTVPSAGINQVQTLETTISTGNI